MQRRHFAIAGACAAAFAAFATPHAQAQAAWPSGPITLIVPFAPGGTTDIVGRALAAGLSKQLGQTVVVENKPGAGGTLGVVDMQRTKPDGYRLTLAPVGIFRQPYVQKVSYDPLHDQTYIASFTAYDFLLVVAADSPFKTVKDVVAAAKAGKPGVTYGTPGKFTGNQVAMSLLGKAAGVKFTHVPYKGDSEAINALLGGHVDTIVVTNGIRSFLESGKVRALAIAADNRVPAFANVPHLQGSRIRRGRAVAAGAGRAQGTAGGDRRKTRRGDQGGAGRTRVEKHDGDARHPQRLSWPPGLRRVRAAPLRRREGDRRVAGPERLRHAHPQPAIQRKP